VEQRSGTLFIFWLADVRYDEALLLSLRPAGFNRQVNLFSEAKRGAAGILGPYHYQPGVVASSDCSILQSDLLYILYYAPELAGLLPCITRYQYVMS
jgi:hypothetical protein